MTRGPDAEPPPTDYIATVEKLYECDETNESGGVPTIAIADELDVAPSTAHRHLDRLVDEGELVDCYDLPGQRGGHPPRGFRPPDTTGE